MDRGFSPATIAETGKDSNRPLHLIEIWFDTQLVPMTDSYRAINWNGNVYIATGHLLNFSGVEESAELQVTQATVTLSGVDQVWIANVMQQNYIDRRLVIYKGFLDAADALVVDPGPIFDGRMDAPVIDEDPASGQCTVMITAASHWTDFERTPGRHTNDAEQQIWFPGDKGFEFVSQLNKQIIWGRP